MKEDPEINVVYIYVEEIQGNLYAWEEETDQFLGQGSTVEALFERLKADLADGMVHVFKVAADRGGKLLTQRGIQEMQEI